MTRKRKNCSPEEKTAILQAAPGRKGEGWKAWRTSRLQRPEQLHFLDRQRPAKRQHFVEKPAQFAAAIPKTNPPKAPSSGVAESETTSNGLPSTLSSIVGQDQLATNRCHVPFSQTDGAVSVAKRSSGGRARYITASCRRRRPSASSIGPWRWR